MKELLEKDGITYFRLENAREVEKIKIPEDEGGFDFFHGLGIIEYGQAFKMWLRKFPRPVLVVALKGNTVIGWVYVEEWSESAHDGSAVYVLRAIEVHPEFRRRRLGCYLLAIVLKEVNGYVIAKPLTPQGESFFRHAGFRSAEEFRHSPLDTSKQPNYLILPPYLRENIINPLEKG